MSDAADAVRLEAVAGLAAVQSPLAARRKDFVGDLKRLAEGDPDASVRAAARYALAGLE